MLQRCLEQLLAEAKPAVQRVKHEPAQLGVCFFVCQPDASGKLAVVFSTPEPVMPWVIVVQEMCKRRGNIGFKRKGIAVFLPVGSAMQGGNRADIAGTQLIPHSDVRKAQPLAAGQRGFD